MFSGRVLLLRLKNNSWEFLAVALDLSLSRYSPRLLKEFSLQITSELNKLSSFNDDKYQDVELLRRISGCHEYLARENFERMWCWLYPVAFTLSKQWINAMWSSLSPKWIEGFITKEEAELSLQSSTGLQEPGTFILRFPTSRSWPHPDAGSLVVTYVGNDYALHHRLLTLDHFFRY